MGNKFQNTPALVFDKKKLISNLENFQKCFDFCNVHYAMKANSTDDILKLFKEHDVNFEVASHREFKRLVDLGVEAKNIITSNTYNDPVFIKDAYEKGMRHFTFDTFEEYEKIKKIAPKSDLFLRLTVPDSNSLYPLGQKFGATFLEAIKILKRINPIETPKLGIMFHVGSQAYTLSIWETAMFTASMFRREAEAMGFKIDSLNMGGGFPVKYTTKVPSLEEISKSIKGLIQKYNFRGMKFFVEPGRALVASSGDLISRVFSSVNKNNEKWLIIESGVFNGLMEIIGGFNFEVVSSSKSKKKYKYTVAGPSCDSWDIIGKEILLPETNIGDHITIKSVGAYTTEFASNFNGFEIPTVIIK